MSDQGQGGEQASQNLFSLKLGEYTVRCLGAADGTTDRIVYMHAAMPGETDKVWQLLSCKCVLVGIEGIDWNRDMSPWRHPGVFARGEDFAGGADAYLRELCGRIIPETEQRINSYIGAEFGGITRRYLSGYSLGGLFALYALYHTDLFEGVSSASGSLWYDGFISYMREHEMRRKPGKVYLSIGDREAGGNPRMRTVSERTAEAARLVREQGIPVVLEYNPGGHFQDVPVRIARGIDWLLREEADG